MSQVVRRYADTPDGQLHFRERPGDGPVLLLLHQTPSSSAMWQRVMEQYPAGRRLLAVDSPGFGQSDAPSALPADGMRYYARRMLGFLEALGIEEADVVGHHTGAVIAAELAVQAPARVGRLVLIGPVLVTAQEGRDYLDHITRWATDAGGAYVSDTLLPRLRTSITTDDSEHFNEELIANLQCGPDWWWIYEAVFGYDGHDRMPRIQAPTLVSVGGAEPGMHAWARASAAVIPGAYFEELPGLEVEMTYQQPAAVLDSIERFLLRRGSPADPTPLPA